MCNQRNIIPPTLQQAHKRSGDIPNKRNSQTTENSAERRYSGYIKKESTSAVQKRLLNVENNNKG
jgi:hypothetical protein